MSFIDIIQGLFSKKPDPLDELLIEKGIDPEQVMEDAYYDRQDDDGSNAVNRARERHDIKMEKGRKAAKQAKSTMGGGGAGLLN